MGSVHTVSLAGDRPGGSGDSVSIFIDEYPWPDKDRVLYFAGQQIKLSGKNAKEAVRGWRINGEKHNQPILNLTVTQDIEISPLY